MPTGPCIVCGDTNYSLSCGGPSICPPCDCGIPPEVTKLRKLLQKATTEIIRLEKENAELRAILKG